MVSTQDSKARIGLPCSTYINTEEGQVSDINDEKKIFYLPLMDKILTGTESGSGQEFLTEFAINTDLITEAFYMVTIKGIYSGHNNVGLCAIGNGEGLGFVTKYSKRMLFDDGVGAIKQTFDTLIKGHDLSVSAGTFRFTWGSGGNIEWIRAIPVIPIIVGAGFDEMDATADEGNTELGLVEYTPIPDAKGVGSCKLTDVRADPDRRIYGFDFVLTDADMYLKEIDIDNGFIKVEWKDNNNFFRFYYNELSEWKHFATVFLDGNYEYDFYFSKNTEETITLKIKRIDTDDEFSITIKRGDPFAHLSGEGNWNSTNEIKNGVSRWNIIDKGNDTLDCVESTGWHSFNLATGSNSYYSIHNNFLRSVIYQRGQNITIIGRKKVTTDCQWYIIHSTDNYIEKVKNILDDDVFLGVLPNPYVFYNWLECEDMVLALGATSVADAGASGGYVARLDAQNEKATLTMNYCNETYLPKGKYRFYYRAKDSNQITDDLLLRIRNVSDVTNLYNQSQTLTASYGWKYADFEIDANEEGDAIEIFFMKQLVNVNSISLDEYFIIPRERSDDSLTHQDFIDGKWGIAKSYLKQVTQKISHARRD